MCLSPLTLWVRIPFRRGVLDTTLCEKVCQWLVSGRWFSPDTPVSSTNKTDPHDITEILLKVTLFIVKNYSRIISLINQKCLKYEHSHLIWNYMKKIKQFTYREPFFFINQVILNVIPKSIYVNVVLFFKIKTQKNNNLINFSNIRIHTLTLSLEYIYQLYHYVYVWFISLHVIALVIYHYFQCLFHQFVDFILFQWTPHMYQFQ
jgi:hypothetical protein